MTTQIEEAVLHERQTTADKMADLEARYAAIVDQLTCLQPVLSQFVESYILLQKEVKRFPKMIDKTVAAVSKQVTHCGWLELYAENWLS